MVHTIGYNVHGSVSGPPWYFFHTPSYVKRGPRSFEEYRIYLDIYQFSVCLDIIPSVPLVSASHLFEMYVASLEDRETAPPKRRRRGTHRHPTGEGEGNTEQTRHPLQRRRERKKHHPKGEEGRKAAPHERRRRKTSPAQHTPTCMQCGAYCRLLLATSLFVHCSSVLQVGFDQSC